MSLRPLLQPRKFSIAVASLLLSAVLQPRAAFAQELPVLAIETIEIRHSSACAKLVAEINDAMREGHGVPLFLRTYETQSLGEESSAAFSLSPADSFATLMRNRHLFASDPKMAALRQKLDVQVTFGQPTYLKAIRFDGANSPGWLLNTLVEAADESALLRHVEGLRADLSANGQAKIKINVFRVIAGNRDFSHLVSLNAASEDDLAKAMDAIAAGSPRDIASAKVARSALYRELLK